MTYKVNGELVKIFDTKNVTDRFKKRELVLRNAENPDFPQYILFQLTGDKCGHLDSFSTGDSICLSFNIRGKEWKSPDGTLKYFNSLDVWKIELTEDR